jgi:pimeloyl-ACP methyl ester carboxylesterase
LVADASSSQAHEPIRDSARRFTADIAGSESVVFDSLGHVPHEEDPVASVAPVRRFLGLQP